MAFEESNGSGMVMPVSPMYGGGNGNGFGWGGDWAWIILLLLLGWGNNGWGGNGGFDGGLYPWMNQTETINDGFRDQMINTNITSIRDGISDISSQLCNGFAGVTAGVSNGFAQAEIAANARQMADMNRSFDLQSQLAQAERDNLGLQNQLNMATIQNGLNGEVDALYNRLKSCPVPSMPVYGTTPIFTCGGNNAGCGCGGNF